MIRKRFIEILRYAILMIAVGVAYGFICEKTGIAIPCIFHKITGLKCPACGVTRMCIALMHLDFQAAYRSNPMLFVLSPVLLGTAFKYVVDYIRTGKWRLGFIQNILLYICIALLVIFGIYRNLEKLHMYLLRAGQWVGII